MVDVSNLDRVISIDAAGQTAVVEPNVPMDRLLDKALEHGLLPPVITEFPGITVGGAIQGGAGESSSFKWGFFSQAVNWHEFILPDGQIIKSSPDEHSDLFYGSAGSCGSLGIISAAEIQLIPAKKYVQLTYVPVKSFNEATSTMLALAATDNDFIDGIMFGADHGLIITGKLSDIVVGKLHRFSRARDQWYYLHAESIDKSGKQQTLTVPLKDYLFRYDRGAFWVGRFAFERFGVPYNRFTRFLLDPLLHTRKLYQALQESGASQEYIVQDLTLPFNTAEKFMQYIHDECIIYPLWLCPIKPEPRSPLLCNGLNTQLAINIGVWGPRIASYEDFVKLNKNIEAKLMTLGGKKWLYAHTYYREDQFWKIYNKRWYDELRKKYKAETLPSIYEKTRVREHYPVNAKRGLFKTMLGRAKLRVQD
jgi:FAD/FMN-containing dehydrogenase